jgi:hypothetical protein
MSMITRRSFLKYSAGASAALTLLWTVRPAFAAVPCAQLLTKYPAGAIARRGIVVASPSGAQRIFLYQIEGLGSCIWIYRQRLCLRMTTVLGRRPGRIFWDGARRRDRHAN